MTDPDDDPIEEILARSRDRAERFQAWLEQLRAGDPTFAEASALYRGHDRMAGRRIPPHRLR